MIARLRAAWLRIAAAGIAGLALLAACGGGGVGSGGTGAPAAGFAVGTVNGFGSVIVDGLAFDDSKVAAVTETAPGMDTPVEVRLGNRVEVGFEQVGTATVVRVEPTIVGPVAGVDAPGRFTVLGQTVSMNSDPAAGPVTQLGGGYLVAADVKAGDVVEVHGLLVPQGGGSAVQATRIDRRDALPAYLKVTGTISELNVSGVSQFKLGGLTVIAAPATVLPTNTGLANGEVVAVLGATLSTDAGGAQRLVAAQIRIKTAPAEASPAYLSGAISGLDTVARSFVIDGTKVDYAAAVLTPSAAALTNGLYVRVQGTLRTDGTLAAAAVMVRDGETESEAELKGTITGFNAATHTFTVRDVAVDASSATLEGCPAAGLADGLFVEIHGSLSSTAVIATEVGCEGEPQGGIVEREGQAGNVDLAAKTFVLTHDGTTQPVAWTADTYFRTLTPETLSGNSVGVEGTLSGGVLIATKIKLED
jgi:hypothetical protein